MSTKVLSRHVVVVFLAVLILAVSWAMPVTAFSFQSLAALASASRMDKDEHLLVNALVQIHDADLDAALKTLKLVVDRNPKFRLARLIYGDLLLARSGIIKPFASRSSLSDSDLGNLLKEARLRLQYRLSPPPRDALPEALLQLSESQQYVLVVDISQSRLYVYEQRAGTPILIGNYYATTGMGGALKQKEGDGKTPLGVYFITSRLAPDNLPDLYGTGAFPINYPNEWDSRLGRTGYGIWIHGVPSNTYNRAPQETYGCVALPNNDVSVLWKLLKKNSTPVILTKKINWISKSKLQGRRSLIQNFLEAWRKDWGQPQFTRHYSNKYSVPGNKDWSSLKQAHRDRFNRQSLRMGMSDISFFAYPGEPKLVVVTFTQEFGPSNRGRDKRKRQYWRYEADGQWRIVYEGIAKYKKIHLQGIPPSARVGLSSILGE